MYIGKAAIRYGRFSAGTFTFLSVIKLVINVKLVFLIY